MEESGYDHGGVGRFLAGGTVGEPSARIRARELYTAYVEWMEANGLSRWTLTETAFGRAVKDHGIEHKRMERGTYYLGLTRKD